MAHCTFQMKNQLIQISLALLQLNIAYADHPGNGTMFGRHNQQDFIERILKAHNDDRMLVNSPPVGWDQQLADCAYVAACFQNTGYPGKLNPHSFQIGLRPCNSYTCGGVTCKYTSNTENVAGFAETPEGDGFITRGGISLWLAEVGGHHAAVQNPENTRIGCGTYGENKSGDLYCICSTGRGFFPTYPKGNLP